MALLDLSPQRFVTDGPSRLRSNNVPPTVGMEDLETAMRLNPDEPAMHIWYYQAGMAAVHAGQAEAALEWFRKSEQASPAYLTHILPWRAVALAELGRDDEARALVAQRLARTPSQTLAMWNEQFPRHNEEVNAQRKRIAGMLQHLGLPDGRYAKTGSTQ